MDIIICDISAWEYWRTPPAIRDVEIPLEVACAPKPEGLGFNKRLVSPRANAQRPEALILPRLLTDLKGLSLPVHVMVADSMRHKSDVLAVHRLPAYIAREHVCDLGGGLFVATPELSLMRPRSGVSPVALAQDMFEACGLYACPPKTAATAFVLNKLLEAGDPSVDPSAQRTRGLCTYYDADGTVASFVDALGNEAPWSLCFNKLGKATDLWKRPPLTSVEQLEVLTSAFKGAHCSRDILKALKFVHNGSGSPFETKACILLTASARQGGEGWPPPFLNRKVIFDDAAARVAHQGFCVADMLWPDPMDVVELNGEAFHSDRRGFKMETGRTAALESIGYEVVEFTYEQMADLEIYDQVIPAYAERLGLPLSARTPAFLKRRTALHDALFG